VVRRGCAAWAGRLSVQALEQVMSGDARFPTQSSWRDAEAYSDLQRMDRSTLAWACLLRNPAFPAAAVLGQSPPARVLHERPLILAVTVEGRSGFAEWGLHFRGWRRGRSRRDMARGA
jgi:hypothetical protein